MRWLAWVFALIEGAVSGCKRRLGGGRGPVAAKQRGARWRECSRSAEVGIMERRAKGAEHQRTLAGAERVDEYV